MSFGMDHDRQGTTMAPPPPDSPTHRPVMVAEVLDLLHPGRGDRVLDLTIGTGGHALAIGRRLGEDGLLVGIDADRDALAVAESRFAGQLSCRVHLLHGRFSDASRLTADLGIAGFHAVLADLGVGSHQLDDPARGFSFESDARLDMRFDTSGGPTAWDVINRTPERELADIFYHCGEERYSRQIAAALLRAREQQGVNTPAQLSEIVKRVYARRSRGRTWRIHPATRVMMALRIYVNRELEELEQLLAALPSLLAPGGRAAILTYHSLEARMVKHTWREQQREGTLELLARKAVKPSEQEVETNPRARSAQLRGVRRPEEGPPCKS